MVDPAIWDKSPDIQGKMVVVYYYGSTINQFPHRKASVLFGFAHGFHGSRKSEAQASGTLSCTRP